MQVCNSVSVSIYKPQPIGKNIAMSINIRPLNKICTNFGMIARIELASIFRHLKIILTLANLYIKLYVKQLIFSYARYLICVRTNMTLQEQVLVLLF